MEIGARLKWRHLRNTQWGQVASLGDLTSRNHILLMFGSFLLFWSANARRFYCSVMELFLCGLSKCDLYFLKTCLPTFYAFKNCLWDQNIVSLTGNECATNWRHNHDTGFTLRQIPEISSMVSLCCKFVHSRGIPDMFFSSHQDNLRLQNNPMILQWKNSVRMLFTAPLATSQQAMS